MRKKNVAQLSVNLAYRFLMRLHDLNFLLVLSVIGCSSTDKNDGGGGGAGVIATAPADDCGSVRLTSYQASKGGWCEFDRTANVLPESVRAGLTLAIAEPWAGSSYQGDFGEACGECWEIATISGAEIVMVHDLCPVEGNPICNGSHFHFDVSSETANALGLDGLDAAQTRRVPCPVTGNAHLQIIDRNRWGYVRFQVLNHRVPVRSIEYKSTKSETYYAAKRSGGAWSVGDVSDMFAEDGLGGSFRLTSALGQVVEMPAVLTYDVAIDSFFDLGGQFEAKADGSDSTCHFSAPADVYVDGYGGIDQVRWMMNPWASAEPEEITDGCVSGSCLRIKGLGSGAGFHIYYRQSFSPTVFSSLELSHRSIEGDAKFEVTLTGDGTACESATITTTTKWAKESIDLKTLCAGVGPINSVTVYGSQPLTLLLDNLRFVE
jgi:hypothetical protein